MSLSLTWTTKASLLSGTGGEAADYDYLNGKLYVIDGNDGSIVRSSTLLSSISVYDPTLNTWQTDSATDQVARVGVASAVDAYGNIYIIGGLAESNNVATPTATVTVFDPAHDRVLSISSLVDPRTFAAAATGSNGKTYVFGGLGPAGTDLSSDEVYDPAATSPQWTPTGSLPQGLDGLSAVADGRFIYLFGGETSRGVYSNSVYLFDTTTGTVLPDPAPVPMPTAVAYATAGLVGGKIVIAGGTSGNGATTTTQIFDPATFAWTTGPAMPTAEDGAGQGLVSNGSVLFVANNQTLETASGLLTAGQVQLTPPTTTEDTATTVSATATFTDGNSSDIASVFTANIDWGDGTSNVGTVTGSNGSFTVAGNHIYQPQDEGNDTVVVTISEVGGSTLSMSGTATVNDAALTNAQGSGDIAFEGATFQGSVATFTDDNPNATTNDFTNVTIDWGDGTVTNGMVTQPGAPGTNFVVAGSHTYGDEGNFPYTVTITDDGGSTASASGEITVFDGDTLTPHGVSISATAHQAFSGTVATFSDSDTANVASDFTATIDWGDGSALSPDITVGTVTGSNGSFTVSGSHTYTAPGSNTVNVTLSDDAQHTATILATSTAAVSSTTPYDFNDDGKSDLLFQNNGEPGIWLWNGTAPTAEVGLTNPGASWHIVASRDVNGDGMADLIWQNNDGTPGIWLMNGTTPIAEAGLANPGPSWNLVAAGDVNGDGNADLIWQDGSGNLGVWEMNGTTPIAEAGIGNPGTHWNVVDTADFNGDGKDDILLQNTTTGNLQIDLMNGTSIASTVSIAVGDPSWHAVSTGQFNGQADIAWQNNNGAVGLWLMNGTAPAAEVGLGNPGAGWQLVSVDHFTPNGQPDLLFQNTNGAMMLWEMNGTSLAATVNLPSPGAGWQSVNGHPFATG